MSSQMKKSPTSQPVIAQPVTPPAPKAEMHPVVKEAFDLIKSRDVQSIAYSGGVILQDLAIRDPAHWAGGAGELGNKIRKEIFNDKGGLKEKYVVVGNNLVNNIDIKIQPALLSSLMLRVAAVNVVSSS